MSAAGFIALLAVIGGIVYAVTRKDDEQTMSDEWVRGQIYARGKRRQS